METIEIYLNSKNASQMRGDTSDCYFDLPMITTMTDETAYVSVKSGTIPYSWYNVNSSNNLLLFTINEVEYSLTITPGNYNVNTLALELQSLFALGGFTFTVTYVSKTNRFDFKYIGDFVFKKESTCFEILGLSIQDHYSLVTLGKRILQSTNGVNLFTVRQLLICSDNFILGNIDSSNSGNRNIISSVAVTGNPDSMISFSNTSQHKIHHTKNLTSLHIQIRTDDGALLQLNRCHWSITLAINIV